MPGKILVTGATGTVGSAIVKALVDKKASVRAGVRQPAKAQSLGPQVETLLLDYDRTETFGPAMAGVEKLALLSPPFSPPNEVEQAAGLVEAAKQAGVRHIVRLSVMGAEYNDQLQHRRVEKLIEASGILYTFLRPNFYMQNYNTYTADDIRRGVIYLPTGNGKQSLVDARDVAAAFAVILTEPGHENKAYTITGSEALDHYEMADILSRVLGRRITYADPSVEDYRRTMQAAGMPEPVIDSMVSLYQLVAQGWTAGISPELTQILGRSATTFEEYARDYADAWR